MIQTISRKYINFCIHQKIKNGSRKRQFVNLNEVSNILLLVSADTISEKDLEEMKKKIGDKKQITTWVFKPPHNSSLKNTVYTHLIDKKDISLLQKPSEKIEKSFLGNDRYELLIDLTVDEVLPLKYLLAISKAHCRCGMKKEGYSFYDLEIAAPAKIKETELLTQILHYLESIQTKS